MISRRDESFACPNQSKRVMAGARSSTMQPTGPEREDARRILMTGKIIAVVGATGAQGGGLCRAILKDKNGGYRVRALTRNTESGKAKELEKRGAGVVGGVLGEVEILK